MDKKNLLLDTNVIYLLSGKDSGNCDPKKLKELCKSNFCFLNLYSIFEIFNNSNNNLKDIQKMVEVLEKYKIQICCNEIMYSAVKGDSLKLKVASSANRERVKTMLSKKILPIYAKLFTFLSSINFFILFLFKQNADEEYYKKLGEFVAQLLPIVQCHVQKAMETNFKKDIFSQSYLKKLYAKLLDSFQLSILIGDEKYKNASKGIENDDLYFKTLLKEFQKDDFWNESIKFVMEGSYNQQNPILPNMYKLVFKPKFPTQNDADCFIDDIVKLIFTQSDKLEKEWIKHMIKNLLVDESNLKSNNFVDYFIISDFAKDNKTDFLITFDKAMQKIMELLSFNGKIEQSLGFINSFIKP